MQRSKEELLKEIKKGKKIWINYNPCYINPDQEEFPVPLEDYKKGIENIPEYKEIKAPFECYDLYYKGQIDYDREDYPKEGEALFIDEYEYNLIKEYL